MFQVTGELNLMIIFKTKFSAFTCNQESKRGCFQTIFSKQKLFSSRLYSWLYMNVLFILSAVLPIYIASTNI